MTPECKQPGCGRPSRRAGECGTHQQRRLKGQDMSAPHRSEVTPQQRFFKKVNKTSTCWLWTGSTDARGYGTFRLDGRTVGAHRLPYAWDNGPIPAGVDMDHTCHVPSCVNPAHLRPTTHRQNMQNRSGANSNSKTGIRGVSWRADVRKWHAWASNAGKMHHLGYFNTIEEADAMASAWRREHMPYSLMDQKKEA